MTSSILEDPVPCNERSWIRALHILCNFLLSFLGAGGLAIGILFKMGLSDDLKLLDHYQSIHVDIFLACSTILIAISSLGIFAGLKNCYKSTLANGLILGAFLLNTTCYVITMGIVTNYTQTGYLYKQMRQEMNNYNKYMKIIDTLQTALSCCGLHGITTWDTSDFPKSCCRNAGNQTECVLGSPHLQTNGCFEELIRTSHYYAWILFTVLIFVGLFEIFGIILSHIQCRIIKDAQKKKLAKESLLMIPRPQIVTAEQSKVQNIEEEKNEENKDAEEPAERKKGKIGSPDKKRKENGNPEKKKEEAGNLEKKKEEARNSEKKKEEAEVSNKNDDIKVEQNTKLSH